jgi:hypothetical protein
MRETKYHYQDCIQRIDMILNQNILVIKKTAEQIFDVILHFTFLSFVGDSLLTLGC